MGGNAGNGGVTSIELLFGIGDVPGNKNHFFKEKD